ncbi:MAG: protein-glutamate O-methyltransferase CheR [Myxococcales bacterium]|nr:protein-glutamate O-methyltransferase CheR [Myxococcales bacterium]
MQRLLAAPAGGSSALSPMAFEAIRDLLYSISGITLGPAKHGLVQARLGKRLRELGLDSFEAYVARLGSDPAEVPRMVDAMTTNKTSFFREAVHFDFLLERALPVWRRPDHRPRVWSAGCSTGEEPYSLAMLLVESLSEPRLRDASILATDISERVLARARSGEYSGGALGDIAPRRRERFFEPSETGGRVRPEVRSLVRFARLNLLESWPMRGPFDAIFCRNVMIYFDEPTRARLAQRFRALLAPGGLLLIGHSETLGASHEGFTCLRPSVYARDR